MKIILSFATEVFQLPRDYEHIKEMAEFLTAEGLVGNFHLTGDYARALKRLGRTDVADALRQHEIGYHCNHHGAHPFMGAYMEEKDWRGATADWFANELPGVGVVEEFFGRRPAYYTTEFAKAPQTVYASWLAGLPITGYLLAPTRGHGAVWFCNSFVPNSENLWGLEWPSRGRVDVEQFFVAQFHTFEERLRSQKTDLARVIQHSYTVYGKRPFGMPTMYQDDRLRYEDSSSVREVLPEEIVRERMAVIKNAARYYAERAEFVSFSGYRNSFRDNQGQWLDLADVDGMASFLGAQLDAYVTDRLSVSPAETFGILVRVLRSYRDEGALPERVFMRNLIGPTGPIPSEAPDDAVPSSAMLDVLRDVDRALDDEAAVPASVGLGDKTFGPGQFLGGLRELYVAARQGKLPDTVRLAGRNLPVIADEPFFTQETFTRPIYPNGFEGRNICRTCRLQSWSWKPALTV